ncbi:MAG: hypothetical protein WC551_08415 [Patescibacteria group bacterium]
MKRAIIIAVVAVILSIPLTSSAQTCSSPININALLPSMRLNAVKNALLNYASHPEGDHYELCFIMDEMELTSTQLGTSFKLETVPAETKDVYVTGFKIKSNSSDPINVPIFVADNQGTGTVYLKNIAFSNVKNGLKLEGTGKVEVGSYNDNKTVITGDSAKSGACIDVKSPGAVLSGVQASSCHEGVKVDADNVMVKDESVVMGNHIGIHVLSGRKVASVEKSKIYFNDDGDSASLLRNDGIRLDDPPMHEIVFYDVVSNELVDISDGEDPIEYKGRNAYMLLNIPEGKTGKVEFYVSEDAGCGLGVESHANGQPCALVGGMTNPVSVASTDLSQGPIDVTLPPEYYDKNLVALYSDPERGTAGISRQFKLSDQGVVAFVANPYDIPTSGGAVDAGTTGSSDDDDDSDSATTGASSMGGEGAMAEGGSGIIGAANAAGGCGGGSSLMGLAWHDASLGGILWCLLLALGSIASMRMVQVKVRRKQ